MPELVRVAMEMLLYAVWATVGFAFGRRDHACEEWHRKEEAAEKALQEKERALELAKAQLAAATAAAERAKAAERESAEKAEAARKQLLTADPAVAEFKTLFEQWQKIYHDMDEKLKRIGGEDAEKADKLRKAVRAAAAGMGA